MSRHTVPTWALQRVAAVVNTKSANGRRALGPAEVARRSGLNKRLVRQCLYVLQHPRPVPHRVNQLASDT
jgi:hypothetical protein